MADPNVVRVLGRRASHDPLPTGTVTFLLADIEASVRLWEADRESMTGAVGRLNALVDQLVTQHHGARPVEQGEGDSFVAAFASAPDAVGCALDLQVAMSEEAWPGGISLRVRMALHTGEAQLRDEGNYVGTAISRCGRLRSLAHGGQTVLSPTTYELVADLLPERAGVRDLGLQHIRDVSRPLRVFQLIHPRLQDSFPPLRSLEVLTRNLPSRLTTFVGREAELRDVEALLARNRLLTLTGAGGCGKTRLALRAAELAAEHYPDGIWFVDLALVQEADDVGSAVAAALGRMKEGRRAIEDTILDHLRDRHALVLLDNCEHVVDRCAALADTLLRECPGLTILATSREPLRVEGESTWRVPSMPTPTGGDAAALDTFDAVRLFIDRALDARPNFRVTNDNAPAVASICNQLDGIPLAIELAAARVRVLTPEQIAHGLSDRFRLLRGGARTALPRQQTLTASVDWSYDLLTDTERSLLRRLCAFVGGFTLDAAEQVAADDGIDALEVFDLLSSLVDKSLVVTAEDGPDGRYQLLETIRQYARERAESSGELEAARDRHLAVFERFARDIGPRATGPDQTEWLARIDADLDNVRAALDRAVTTGAAASGLRIVAALGMFFNIRPHWHETVRWIEKLMAVADGGLSPRLRRTGDFLRAAFGGMVGHVDPAIPVMERIAVESAAEQNHRLQAWAENQLGKYVGGRDLDRALAHLAESVKAAGIAGDSALLEDSVAFMGWLNLAAGRTASAAAMLDESRRRAREAGDHRSVAIALAPRAVAAIRSADYEAARRMLDECMELAASIDDRFYVAVALVLSGDVEMSTGRYQEARELVEEGIETGKETGSPFLAVTERYLGRLALLEGDAAAACEIFEKATATLPEFSNWLFAFAQGAGAVGEAYLAAGRHDEAHRVIEDAIAEAQRTGSAFALGGHLLARARLSRAKGELQAAEADAHRALATFVEARARVDTMAALELLAFLADDLESPTEAARLLAAADAARVACGSVRGVYEQRAFDDVAVSVRGQAAWREGEAMTLDEAAAYAARGRGTRKRPSTGWESLTPTELDVVRLIASGATNREAADQLFMSANTVKAHLSHVFAKLGVSNRSALAVLATERGLGRAKT